MEVEGFGVVEISGAEGGSIDWLEGLFGKTFG